MSTPTVPSALSPQMALALAQEAGPDGLLVVAPDGRVAFRNAHFAEIWRFSQSVPAAEDDEVALAAALDGWPTPRRSSPGCVRCTRPGSPLPTRSTCATGGCSTATARRCSTRAVSTWATPVDGKRVWAAPPPG